MPRQTSLLLTQIRETNPKPTQNEKLLHRLQEQVQPKQLHPRACYEHHQVLYRVTSLHLQVFLFYFLFLLKKEYRSL